ncbi:VOC family protein [Streptomyces sp. NPDC019224]|uniref:VOC family protein n=1 Tax=Streptomyces sp. NPDC019224 TaxID=3154484 RepID=UPI0033EA4577
MAAFAQSVPCWVDVRLPDLEAGRRFYGELFGFRCADIDDSAPGVPDTDERRVDFRIWSPPGTEPGPGTAVGGRGVITDAFPAELPSHFLSCFDVADCDDTARTVRRLGGRVTEPPLDIPYGRMAVLQDDQGAEFAVLQEPVS